MMTEQPKEYITTGDEIDEIEKRFNDLIEKGTIPWEEDCLNTLDNIRSHPVSIPPEGAAPAHSPDAHVPGRGRMTPTDNYPTPSNGSLICTFSDCPIRYPALTMQPPCHWCGLSGKFCHEQRKDNNCPRGFQS